MTDRPLKRAGSGKRSGRADGRGGDPTGGRTKNGGSAKPPSGDYEVGYGRPPLNTRFQKGQPRPPRKPKPETEPGVDDWFDEELRLPMRFVDENGKEQVFPKGKVLVKTTVNKAIRNGDLRSVKEFMPRRPPREVNEISQTDLATIARFLVNQFPGGLDGLKDLMGGGVGSATNDDHEVDGDPESAGAVSETDAKAGRDREAGDAA